MATRDRHEIQVGLALVVSVVVLIAGLLWFQRYQFNALHRDVKVVFVTAGGLGAGDPVQVRGLPMGKVTEISLVGEGVLVELELDKQVVLSENASFKVGSAGLLGERMVVVEPGLGKLAPDDPEHVFEGQYEPALTDMVGQVQVLTESVLGFLQRMGDTLASIEENGGLGEAVAQTTRAAQAAADMMEANGETLQRASSGMAEAAGKLNAFLDDHGTAMGESVQGLARTATELDSLMAGLQEVTDGTQEILTAIRSQEGTLGKMIYDKQMAADVTASVEKLRLLLDDIKRNPQRYLTVKVF